MTKQRVTGISYVKNGVNLCQFEGFSCFGCCGYEFKGKKKAADSVYKQTKEYKRFGDGKYDRLRFRERRKFDDLNSGNFCRNLILEKGLSKSELMRKKKVKLLCPLHPVHNDKLDLRDGHCDKDYMCEMQVQFHKMKKIERERFIKWLRKRIKKEDIDWHTYSVFMDEDVFLKEYNRLTPEKS